MAEVRATQKKAEETGFITPDELMRLNKAGFKRPRDVSLKPAPKDRMVLPQSLRSFPTKF